jgi:hypothetical protein
MKLDRMTLKTFFNKTFWWICGALAVGGALDMALFLSGHFTNSNDMEKLTTTPEIIGDVFFVLFGPGIAIFAISCVDTVWCSVPSSTYGIYALAFFFSILSLFFWALLARGAVYVCMMLCRVFSSKILPLLKKK